MCNWHDAIYNDAAPPRRRLNINGHQGSFFTLGSGVPQGSLPLNFDNDRPPKVDDRQPAAQLSE